MAQSLSSAAEANPLSNSAARADLIREAVRVLAEKEREVQALNAEIREYKTRTIKGDLGFKLADWNAVYRVSQLEVEDRDALLECVREGFQALGIGGSVDWVAASQSTPRRHSGAAAANSVARLLGHEDGLSGGHDHAEEYPQGEAGHGDYMLGLADGEAERERVMALDVMEGRTSPDEARAANGPRRGRGRPRKQQVEADAEF